MKQSADVMNATTEQIAAEIESAKKTITRFKVDRETVVKATKIGRRTSLGFHFESGLEVGKEYRHEDGSRYTVLAVLPPYGADREAMQNDSDLAVCAYR